MNLTEYLEKLVISRGVSKDVSQYLVPMFLDELRRFYPQINPQTSYARLEYNVFSFTIPLEIKDGLETRYIQKDLPGWRALFWRTVGDVFSNPHWKAKGRTFKTYQANHIISRSYKVEIINLQTWTKTGAQSIRLYAFYEPISDTFYTCERKESPNASPTG